VVSLMCGEITVGYRCAGRNHSSRSIDMRLPSLILPFTVFALITRENSEAENREGGEGNSMGLILDARSSTQYFGSVRVSPQDLRRPLCRSSRTRTHSHLLARMRGSVR